MNLQEYYIALRIDLKDPGTLWTDDQLNRCVRKAIADLSRFLPLEQVYELSLQFTVTPEAWTSADEAGTYVALANKPIKYASEAVLNEASVDCVKDTDYTIDYANGKITHISGGKIGNGKACTITYTKSQISVDLSDLTGLIRINRVEYPVGSIPQSFIAAGIWGKVVTIEEGDTESREQGPMAEDRHVAVQYWKEHTAPTNLLDGTYPGFLDETVALAAAAYALMIKAVQYEHQSVTDMAASRTSLGNIAAIHTLVASALAKIASYGGNAATALGKVATHAADADTALNAAASQLGKAAVALAQINAAGMPCLTDADSALDNFASAIAKAPVALSKVTTYLIGATESTKALLAQILTDTANLRGGIVASLGAAQSFLAKVETADLTAVDAIWAEEVKHILTAEGIPNAEDFIESGDDSIDISTILTAVEGALEKIATEVDAGKDYLKDGDALINKVPVGANAAGLFRDYGNAQIAVGAGYRLEADQRTREANAQQMQAELYLRYAQAALDMARLWDSKRKDLLTQAMARTAAARGYAEEAATRLNSLRSYIEQATAYARIADGFTAEAAQRTAAARPFIDEASVRLGIADRWISEARERVDSATGYVAEANGRLGMCTAYIGEAGGYIAICNAFATEAGQRIAQIDRYLAEANQHAALAESDKTLADRFRQEAIERRNEAWSIWRDPSQYMGDFTLTSVRQPAR